MEYAHTTMTSSAPGLFQFEAFLGYQPPLFPAMPNHLRWCQRIWKAARAALLWTKDRNNGLPDHRRVKLQVTCRDKRFGY